MLTSKERRFLRSWEEQRKGGQWKYLLLYIPIGTFICSIMIAFFFMVFFIEFPGGFWAYVLFCLAVNSAIVIPAWILNEKKFKTIIRREIRQGQLNDDKATDEKLI
jgi:hypothetical protein